MIETGLFTLASVAATLLALRNAIPAREPVRAELVLVIGGVCAAFAVAVFQPSAALSQVHDADLSWLLQMLGLELAKRETGLYLHYREQYGTESAKALPRKAVRSMQRVEVRKSKRKFPIKTEISG